MDKLVEIPHFKIPYQKLLINYMNGQDKGDDNMDEEENLDICLKFEVYEFNE